MPDIIKDGKGTGLLASVNKDNQLMVKSVMIPNVGYRSVVLGDTYFTPMLFKQAVADTEELAGVFMYTGVRMLVGEHLYVSSQEATLTQVTIYAGTTYASGGYTSSSINLNTTSSKTLPVTVKMQADGAVPFVTPVFGTHFYQINIRGGGMAEMDTKDTLILRPNLPLGIGIKCTTQNSLVRVYLTSYEMDLI